MASLPRGTETVDLILRNLEVFRFGSGGLAVGSYGNDRTQLELVGRAVWTARNRLLRRLKPVIRFLPFLLPEPLDSRVAEEQAHAPTPRFPKILINVTSFVKEVLLRTQVKVVENLFALVGRQHALRWIE
jgi:hypothetical protein